LHFGSDRCGESEDRRCAEYTGCGQRAVWRGRRGSLLIKNVKMSTV
jgi:hypothetical protein